ncbi:hypothetical protein AVEN_242046-1 [Araneus ventricosus]|uniref:Mos1 transposase HTH domain-containing protein n=1 Tax=Araneus ventricosus TaxID=182803 RepID=A0A4Y2QRC7_ARAVE|nr:hypothetical protein AVEN_242046-1 [Araneus ventricosus]
MAEKVKQSICIKFSRKLGNTCDDIYARLKKVYGEDGVSRTRVYELFKRFQHGRENVERDDFQTIDKSQNIRDVRLALSETTESLFLSYLKSAALDMVLFSPF